MVFVLVLAPTSRELPPPFPVAIATLSGQVLTFVLYNSSNNFYVFQTS